MTMDSIVARDASRSPLPAGEGLGVRENASPAGNRSPLLPALGAADLLALWETGGPRHALDRALLLASRARPDLPPADLADLPLGVVNQALLRLRTQLFGRHLEVWLDCPHCGERLELDLDTDTLLGAAGGQDMAAELELAGYRFRAPSTRDLAAIAHASDAGEATLALLERCCVARPPTSAASLETLLDQAGAGLEALDPAADFTLDVACEACGQSWNAPLDLGALVWEELAARARGLLLQVHQLARAYGWSEAEILAMSDRRRAIYLDFLGS